MPRKKKEKTSKPIMVWTLDTETRGLFGDIFRVGLYNGTDYLAGNTFGDVKPLLDTYREYENHVFIHNLDFDLAKLAGEFLPQVNLENSIFINNNVAVFHTSSIILHDSLKILPSSLEKLCESFGLGEASKIKLDDHLKENGYTDKGDYFKRVSPDEPMLNLYLQFDCTSLYKILEMVRDISGLSWEDFLKCPTTASLAMKVFKENYPDDYTDACSTNFRGEYGEFVETFIREGYYGGRTEVFKPRLINGYHYDVNSLYPYCMKTFDFPYGYYKVYEGRQAFASFFAWRKTKQGAGFAWVDIEVPEDMHIPPLPKRQGGKLIFPVGKLTGVWAFPELDMAIKHGCYIKEVKEVVFFPKTYPLFKEFVEEFEQIKVTSTGAKREFSKLVQNSLYGKFGMNRIRQTLLDIEHLDEVKEKGERYTQLYHPILQKEFLQVERKAQANYIQPHIAGYVTAYARCVLYEGLVNPSNGEVSYCDTDSIACANQFDESLVHDKEYGKWKLESVVEKGIFIQPKLYFERDIKGKVTTKAKGIPKEILKSFNEETYETIYEKILKGEERIELFENYEVRRKFTSMLKQGVEDFDTPQLIRKGINLRARQKRQMNYESNASSPHKVYDWGEDLEKEFLKEWCTLPDEFNPLEIALNDVDYIRTMKKGDFYFTEYKEIPEKNRRKYFRETGTPLDVWCEDCGLEVDDVLARLSL